MRLVTAVVLAAFALPAAAQDLPAPEQFALRFEYRHWRPALTSEVRYGSGGVEGTLLDAQRDLGLPDERTYELRGALQLAPGHRLRASYIPLEYTGDARVTRSFHFGGSRYDANARVLSDVRGSYLLGGYEWDVVRRPKGLFGLFVAGGVFDGDVRLEAPEQRLAESQDVSTPVAQAGLTARLYSGRVSLQLEAGGLTLGERGHLLEGEATVRLHLSDRLAACAGYRALDVRGEDAPDLVKLRLQGLTFGVELSL